MAFVLQACEAIAEAHAAGIIHRDLKPSNLFVTTGPDGSALVKVLDFGISKALLASGGEGTLTTTSSFVGSPVYSPPEQLVRAHDVDGRADIWSLGTILFEALAGRPPFVGDSVMHVASKIFNDAPTSLIEARPDLPPELCAVVMRCLRKLPEDRFPDVRAFAQALAPFAPAHSVSADRVARIVAASLPSSQLPALADTLHDSSKVAPSGETPHALVSARTPPIAPSRRWVVVAIGSALAGATVVVILALGRAPASSPRAMVPAPTAAADEATVLAPPRVAASDEAPVVEATPSASVSASASVPVPHAAPPTPTKRNPLSVGVK